LDTLDYPLKLLIFTDLNDTLLDQNYDFKPAERALALIREYQIPLILCTSKTRGQTEIYRRRLNIREPLIVENGGAIHFPPGSFPIGRLPAGSLYENGEYILELSGSAESLLPSLLEAAKIVGTEVETIFDMPVERIMGITGMSSEESELARERSYTIYFLCPWKRDELFAELRRRGLKPTWGSYFCHLGATNSKGQSAHKLTALYRELGFFDLITAGFGDNMNDLPLLQMVNMPFLVERPGGGYAEGVEVDDLKKLEGIGPAGWNRGVIDLINGIDWE